MKIAVGILITLLALMLFITSVYLGYAIIAGLFVGG